MGRKKDCMFQYATKELGLLGRFKIIEDTGLITRKQAEKLWFKYKDDFIRHLNDEWVEPEIGIWINCKNDTDYHTSDWHLDSDWKWDGHSFYREVREYFRPPTPEDK